jgi:dTMP kinase
VTAVRGDPNARRRLDHGGVLIAFEGGEGSGKSTQAERLAEWLRQRAVKVTVTHEPGATDFGARLRTILLDSAADAELTSRAEALLFAADRAQHVDAVIRPALDRGEVVITDRYVDSSLAYQGAGRALPLEDVRRLSRWATGGLEPDLTVLLDVDPELGLDRARSRVAAQDRLEKESLDFHNRVRRGFRALAEAAPERYAVIDTSRHPDVVAAVVRAAVLKRIASSREQARGRRPWFRLRGRRRLPESYPGPGGRSRVAERRRDQGENGGPAPERSADPAESHQP